VVRALFPLELDVLPLHVPKCGLEDQFWRREQLLLSRQCAPRSGGLELVTEIAVQRLMHILSRQCATSAVDPGQEADAQQ
jgi:hypothetical protein